MTKGEQGVTVRDGCSPNKHLNSLEDYVYIMAPKANYSLVWHPVPAPPANPDAARPGSRLRLSLR